MNQDIHTQEQNGIGLFNMKIVEICEEDLSTIWNDSKTFLLVFDEKNKQIADYDFSNGLNLLQKENSLVVFFNEEDIVPGKWKFVGTKIIEKNKKIFEETVEVFGEKSGKYTVKKNKNPWKENRTWGEYISFEEREKRIKICRNCEFFNQLDGVCSINNVFVLEFTKHKYYYCPENKWGDKEESEKYATQKFYNDSSLLKNVTINEQDQQNFESELEEYLKGK